VESAGEPTNLELKLLLAAKDATIASLPALVEQLAARVEELERQRGRDSSNSSKPPSLDLLFAKPAPKRSSRTSSGRKRGKQDGAPGVTLRLVEDPDEIVRHKPGACGAHLGYAPVFDKRRHHVLDPRPATAPARDRAPRRGVDLRRLRHHHGGRRPRWAQRRVQYGPGVAARAAWKRPVRTPLLIRNALCSRSLLVCE
jgi:transposase